MAKAVQSQNPSERKVKLSFERVRELLCYDGSTGHFTWKVKPTSWSRVAAGDRAGCLKGPGDYRLIKIDGRSNYEHRVVWLWMTGANPVGQIDHINGNKSDNRFANLRQATGSQNRHNVSVSASNSSGYKGVSWTERYGKWRSGIRINGRYHFFGYFVDPIEAAAVYNFHARRLMGEFARTNKISPDREIVDPHGGRGAVYASAERD